LWVSGYFLIDKQIESLENIRKNSSFVYNQGVNRLEQTAIVVYTIYPDGIITTYSD